MSRHMYYHSFPPAPTALVSGISAAAGIPTIIGAYVGREYNSIFLDVFQSADFRIKAQHLADIADLCGVTLDGVEVGPGIDDDHVSITLETSCFDFSDTDFELVNVTSPGKSLADELDPFFFQKERVQGPFGPLSNLMRGEDTGVAEPEGGAVVTSNLPGTEDSEEAIEAHEKIINLDRK